MRPRIRIGLVAGALAVLAAVPAAAPPPHEIPLLAPRTEGGMPLLQALRERRSQRAFSPRPLPQQLLADLLWAAAGINRPDSGKRTAPSAKNWQEIEVYVLLEQGAYVYDPKANGLRSVAAGDLRKLSGGQEFVATAPLHLVYVADTSKMTRASAEERTLYSATDAAFISQNVYLFCASESLATVVRGGIDREALAKALGLSAEKRIVLAQTVGYPIEEAGK